MQNKAPGNILTRCWRWIVFFIALFWSYLSTSFGWQYRPVIELTTFKSPTPRRSLEILHKPWQPTFVIEDDLDTWFENVLLNSVSANKLDNLVYNDLIIQLKTEFKDHSLSEKEAVHFKLMLLNLNHNLNSIQTLNADYDSDDDFESDFLSSEGSISKTASDPNISVEEYMEKTAHTLDQIIMDAEQEDSEPLKTIDLGEDENHYNLFNQTSLRFDILRRLSSFQNKSSKFLINNHFDHDHLQMLKSDLEKHDSELFDALNTSLITQLKKPQQSTLTANCL